MIELKILELRARLMSAMGDLSVAISCTICCATITGPNSTNHMTDCQLALNTPAQGLKAAQPKPSADKSQPRKKRWELKTGNKYRRPDGSFDRSAWAKENMTKARAKKKPRGGTKALGLPTGLGGLNHLT